MNEADSTLAEPVPAPKRGDEDFDASAELAERRNVLTAADGLLGRRQAKIHRFTPVRF